MRDRLIEILKKSGASFENALPEEIADYLLAEGVIVPPCKVGDEVYWIGNKEKNVKTLIVACVEIDIFRNHIHTVVSTKNNKDNFYSDQEFSNYQFGEELFFTREEAEKALERREG